VLRAGFEPATPGSKGPSVIFSHDERMENIEDERILEDFKNFLTVNRQLGERTVERHILELKRLFENAKFNPLNATKSDIRNYLMMFKEVPANSYANILKTLRIFYRDYLGRLEVVEGFKFPTRPFNAIAIPSKRKLQEFYRWLKEPMAKALFLIYVTTGLRRNEALNLRIGDIDFEKRMIIPKGTPRGLKELGLLSTTMRLKMP